MQKIEKADAITLAITIITCFTLLEISLRLFTLFPIHDNLNIAAHSSLGHTLNPELADVDSDGFRNPEELLKIKPFVLAIGDSHTQGFNVNYVDAWPSRLSTNIDKPVYNYGIGGYGFAQYAYLLETDLSKKSDHILVALFPANDFRPNVCELVPKQFYQSLIDEKIVRLPCPVEPKPFINKSNTTLDWLIKKTAIFSIGCYIYNRARVIEKDNHEIGGHYLKKSRLEIRNRITDISNPEVHQNVNSIVRILKKSHLRKKNIGVLLIPSKSRVLGEWAKSKKIRYPIEFKKTNEAILIERIRMQLIEEGIPVVDATNYVVAAFDADYNQRKKFYPHNDGHPLSSGYAAYSEAANKVLNKIIENSEQ